MLARLDKPLRLTGAVKTAKSAIGGGPSLQSLLKIKSWVHAFDARRRSDAR
jgi:hypothetical protein